MADLKELKQKIKDAIDKGATDLEKIHKEILSMPLDYLAKIGPLEETAKGIKNFSNETVGSIYDFIRKLNQKIDEIATELLDKFEKKKK